jgi:small subunit ribosomal protein S17
MTETETQPGETSTADASRARRKTRVGTVVSDKAHKTVTVVVERRFPHPLYGKGVKRTKRYHAHDENNECRTGDLVRIMETRPLSKTKRWRVVELIERPV